jgi:hypothetical protein
MTMNQTTRRALVAGLALAPIAGVPAIAGAMLEQDPIFAVIAELEPLRKAFNASVEGFDRAEHAYFMGQKDARPELDAAEATISAATSASVEAERAILATEPNTRAGALALLRFVADFVEEWGTGDVADAGGAIRNAVAVLERGEA